MDTDTASQPAGFESYAPAPEVFDEFLDSLGQMRPQWRQFMSAVAAESPSELTRRADHANRIIHENGITYNAFRDKHEAGRPWQIDLLPLMLAADEWESLGTGIAQRARLLSLVLDDVYGPQQLLAAGALPAELIFGHSGFHRPFCHLPVAADHRLMFFGCEVARSQDGEWWAMADRTEGPAGAGYALENRIVLSRTWPKLIHDCHIRRLAPFFMRLQQSLADLAPRATENPRIVLLTAGPGNPSYFEDVYLARYLGYTLVEGGDLAVRDNRVFIKTLDGLIQIDVIFSRVNESELDPVELRTSSAQGISGLMNAIRNGNVAVANSPGCGFVESPAIMAFLPQLCRELLGEELQLPSIATWWCGDDSSRQFVLENLSELVVKPAFEHSGGMEVFGNQISKDELAELACRIRQTPAQYVAQEMVARSSAPIWSQQGLVSGHVALRTFAMRHGHDYEAMPGALVRLAATAGPMELSIAAGDCSKDAWIVADGPIEEFSLLPPADEALQLRRNSPQLPSRVADNLFWLGRHLDRAEMGSRLLRVLVERLSGERDADEIPEMSSLIRVLAASGQIEPKDAIDELNHLEPDFERRLLFAIFEASESRSLRSTVTEIARLASTVRDRLSHDTWRAVNRIDENFCPSSSDVIPLDEALTLLDQLIIDLAVCGGLVNDGMVRGPAWRFMDLGRRIERTQRTSQLLLELIDGGQLPLPSVLDAVLDIMDLQMTYRSRYLAAIRPAPVFDLLIADESNPRSLLSQLNSINQHVCELPGNADQIGLSEPQKIVATARHRLQILDVTEHLSARAGETASPESISELLAKTTEAMTNLCGSLSRQYLVHSGIPRRIQDEPTLP